MRLYYEKLTAPAETPLLVRRIVSEVFAGPLHFHPELELTLILSSTGQRYVGDSLEPFRAGEVVLLGENLPHRWAGATPVGDIPAESISVQFSADFLGPDFLRHAGGSHIAQLLHESRRGLYLTGEAQQVAGETVRRLPELSGFEQVLALLHLLHQVATSQQYRPLSSPDFQLPLRAQDGRHLNQVYGYIYEHLTTGPLLAHAAALLHMSPSAFCHYFKKHTRKTFSQVVNEIRVGQARQQLTGTDHSVADVCYACGFTSISNFNKQFARLAGCAPTQYRRRYQQG